ncbi:CST complex subunit STN1-like isoform X1 [Oncorhynchus kisutch]|uniref:CST complex subunit STN1-like isoform X1 n=1 Tax=Oncorhynchus kisutch TaxID=8019 RepID=UPI0012DC7445|nr:CST complex subunit STN1-like isoform X1 [Oncorhynchus kisutch]
MQPEATEPEEDSVWEEPPSMLWGLDPMFNAFNRLYVKDILHMRESCQVSGIYFYNSHPIFKVDVLGTVVYKREREDFFCYGVDDGTGVINSLCWKDEQWREQGDPATRKCRYSHYSCVSALFMFTVGCVLSSVWARSFGSSTCEDFNPASELKKLRQAQHSSSHLEIGELLRVRGPVKTSRQQREIMASTYYKVSDPVMAVQISWMMEVPQLYRQCYDKPFHLDSSAQNIQGGSASYLLGRATRILKDFLKEKEVTRFRPYDVQDLLQPLVSRQSQKTASEQEPEAGPSSGPPTSFKQLRELLQKSLQILQDEGLVFRKVKCQDEVYHVTERDKDLLMAVRDILREDCRREKYAEKGCHILHILSSVRQRYSRNVSKAALVLVLKALECNSDIISTSDSHYTIL